MLCFYLDNVWSSKIHVLMDAQLIVKCLVTIKNFKINVFTHQPNVVIARG